jgi:hypothetical protein
MLEKERIKIYNIDRIPTEASYVGIAIVRFSTKFGVAPRPIIT